MRQIKKYKNRKLYDLTTSKYTTLAEILRLIKLGITVEVVDQSNNDVTQEVLAQCVVANSESFTSGELHDFLFGA